IQAVNVWPAPCRCKQILKRFGFFPGVAVNKRDSNTTVNPLNPCHFAIRVERKLLVEALEGVLPDRVILNRPNRTAYSEHSYPYTQAAERLTKLQTDDTWPEHHDRFRQVLPLKNIIVHNQPIFCFFQKTGYVGTRTGCNNDPLRLDFC